jgi:2-polyprenyl-3-methyl-5-hydroxy-6-metoxy-1,4-benzoquinol methylase
MNKPHAAEIEAGDRFGFGENWSRFLALLDDDRIRQAQQSLCVMLGVEHLRGKTFLDVGSGSGLFSLAARNLGATVRSFDYDPKSVACTNELRNRYYRADPNWVVETGSVLDEAYVRSLGRFDVVYSWGVLHHTGQMYEALAAVGPAAVDGGQLFIAIYNDQGWVSRYWTHVKRAYNRSAVGRTLMVAMHAPYLYGLRWLVRAASGRRALSRGMSLWHDMIDWLGGYPFEVAKPEDIFSYFRDRGFDLERLKTCGGRMGCNEFVFRRRQGGAEPSSGQSNSAA